MYKKILLPTDGSLSAEKSVKQGIELAKSVGASVIGLYVIDTSSFVSLPETYMWENIKNLLDEEAKKSLKLVKDEAKRMEVKAKILVRDGSPSKEIIKVATLEKADLVIMGTAGRTGLDKFFLGSISEKVLRQSPKPVMIIK